MNNNLSIIQSQVEEEASHEFSIIIPSKNPRPNEEKLKKKQDLPI
jgi:hypothetical protein